MDEYRELSSRLAKVEKRLAKAGRDLAGSMGDGNNNASNKAREPYSICELVDPSINGPVLSPIRRAIQLTFYDSLRTRPFQINSISTLNNIKSIRLTI